MREELRMTRPLMTAEMHGRLVQRRCDNPGHLSPLRKRAGLDNEAVRGFAGERTDLADWCRLQRCTGLDQFYSRRIIGGLRRFRDDTDDRWISAGNLNAPPHRVGIAYDNGHALTADLRMP